MAKLEYSLAAENVLSKFHGVDIMLYVEGEDDVPFWEFLFEKFSSIKVKVQQVGGREEIEKYVSKIKKEVLNAIVAMDSDYSLYCDFYDHKRIIRTYGYSIENTIISSETIRDVVRSVGRVAKKDISLDRFSEWESEFLLRVEELLIWDIHNFLKSLGKPVMGDSCARFLINKKSYKICPKKVEKYISEIGFQVSLEDRDLIKSRWCDHKRTSMDLIRGHFLFSAGLLFATNFIKEIRGASVNLSYGSMFGALMLSFEKTFADSHPHYEHYLYAIQRAVT